MILIVCDKEHCIYLLNAEHLIAFTVVDAIMTFERITFNWNGSEMKVKQLSQFVDTVYNMRWHGKIHSEL